MRCAPLALLTLAACGARTGLPLATPDDAPATDAGAAVTPIGGDSIATAFGYTCALDGAGGVLCWGEGSTGMLGDGTERHLPCGVEHSCVPVPVRVAGLSDAVAVTAGDSSACALRATGGIACWGGGSVGQLGDGTFVPSRATPAPVVRITDALEVSMSPTGDHACARVASVGVMCWGETLGLLDDGVSELRSNEPVPVFDLSDAVDVTTSPNQSCAVRRGGTVVCWGLDTPIATAPSPVPGIVDAIRVSRSCALRATGSVVCWSDPRGPATPVPGLTDAVALSARYGGGCARRATGAVVCWGDDAVGELGDGTMISRDAAAPVAGELVAIDVAASPTHGCARGGMGEILCWGDNGLGQLGDGTYVRRLAPVGVLLPP